MAAARFSPAVLAWLALFFAVLGWSAVNPHDRLTGWLEVCFCLAFSAFYGLIEWWAALLLFSRLHHRQLEGLNR